MKKYVFCIAASDDFALATAVLIYSLKKNVQRFSEFDVVVTYNNLNDQSKNLIMKAHKETIFKKPHNSDFYKHIPRTIYGTNNYDVYLSFETFSQIGYEKSIYFDADMLCTQDISEVLDYNQEVSWVYPNLGILVVNQNHLTGSTYNKMIDYVVNTNVKHKPDGDQVTCQHLFSPSEKVQVLPKVYNFQDFGLGGKGSNTSYDALTKEIKVIHYSGRRKPWGPIWDGQENNKNCIRYASLIPENNAVKIWYEYYDEFKEQHLQ